MDRVDTMKKKDFNIAFLLWLFLGWFGAHRFYLGFLESKTMFTIGLYTVLFAILKLDPSFLLFGMLFIWQIYDIFLIKNYFKSEISKDKN